MVKGIFLFISFFAISVFSFSQKSYFQQEVNFNIEVTLDDEKDLLSGIAQVEYINHSSDNLDSIFFHLWPNAYKNQQTDFSKQQLQNHATKFYFSEKKEKGSFKEIEFNIEGLSIDWKF